jgi:hypothetical protein
MKIKKDLIPVAAGMFKSKIPAQHWSKLVYEPTT